MICVYILFSEKLDRFYTGFTTNFDLRLDFHLNSNEKRKYTYNADDWVLFLKIECESTKQALSIEKHIKSIKSKTYIKNLIVYPEIILRLKEKYFNENDN